MLSVHRQREWLQDKSSVSFLLWQLATRQVRPVSWLTIEALQEGIDYWSPNLLIHVHVVGISIEDMIYSERTVHQLLTT